MDEHHYNFDMAVLDQLKAEGWQPDVVKMEPPTYRLVNPRLDVATPTTQSLDHLPFLYINWQHARRA